MDNFVQFLANKEWKARNGKWEMEQQKEKIKKQKNHLNSKYQTQINRLKSLSLIKNYYQDQDTKLRTTIKDLQD
ncbi:MAG: hypothetical protein I3273_06555, partial [Candidatus Moeniiplasma glomeromycotorum]|nr:hypothetical protein [Candidatus Moeniiplasma glomeromycotorum]MCE8168479.1 hypothetical protein [Candidatus Moeniiplasma glomeromycotorum]MCE8169746.1 hypothetical protein [Candidatus Moeniiplasma glomeromycotorum]